MNARRIGSELKMLAAGLLLGRLVLRKPATPEPVVVRIAEPAPTPRHKLLGLTQNALVTGIIAAVVSGVIAFAVAHYQSQDSAAQARRSQDIAGLTQVESAATGFFQAAVSLYQVRSRCLRSETVNTPGCPASTQDFIGSENVLNTALSNVREQNIIRLSQQMFAASADWLSSATKAEIVVVNNRLEDAYLELVFRCGQLIKEQS